MDSKSNKKEHENENHQLHIFFLPYLAQGHMIPLLGTAKLFSELGVRASIVTTPGNAYVFSDTIEEATRCGLSMELLLVPFPDIGLPPGCENSSNIPDFDDSGYHVKLCQASHLLREPFEDLLRTHNPDFIVGDSVILWPGGVAESFSIPYIQFNVSSLFANCVMGKIYSQSAHLNVDTLTGTMSPLVGLPHRLVLQRAELPQTFDQRSEFIEYYAAQTRKSLGVIYNTFHELEPEYVEYIDQKGGNVKKAWCVGPVQLSSTTAPKNWEWIKNWLDSKETESVLYVSFGSMWKFSDEQLRELAIGLDTSGHSFILVVKEDEATWMPEGFNERIDGRGLVIAEWVPQFLILNHPALGGNVLHCGWNSVIESLCAGLPAIAWPLHSEHFLLERFVVDVLKTGVRLLEGDMRTTKSEDKRVVSREKVKEAVVKLLGGGEEVKEMRKKAKEYSKLAKMATRKGGSSSVQLRTLLQELTVISRQKRNKATSASTTTSK